MEKETKRREINAEHGCAKVRKAEFEGLNHRFIDLETHTHDCQHYLLRNNERGE